MIRKVCCVCSVEYGQINDGLKRDVKSHGFCGQGCLRKYLLEQNLNPEDFKNIKEKSDEKTFEIRNQ